MLKLHTKKRKKRKNYKQKLLGLESWMLKNWGEKKKKKKTPCWDW